jgi:hypothetical protein
MEILEQLRFLFIIVMAYLSYRQIQANPLAIDYVSDEEDPIEEELPLPSHTETPHQEQQEGEEQKEEVIVEEGGKIASRGEKEIVTVNSLESVNEQANIEEEVDLVSEDEEAEEENADPATLPKTKRIRKTRKRSLKRE